MVSILSILFILTACGADNREGNMKNNDFIRIEGGTFKMGDVDQEENEAPPHQVTLSSFLMSRYEVSQAEWKKIMGSNPSWISGDDLPVEQVTWHMAIEYCNKRSIAEGLTPCYSGSGDDILCDWNADGYRLPTEAEWEFAAQGGSGSVGTSYSGSDNADEVAWHKANGRGTTHPGGTKAPNKLGLYDMSGNVYEWVWDRYGSYNAESQSDPRGPSTGIRRVLRGGSWAFDKSCCRITFRRIVSPDYVGCGGLRLVRSVR